MKDLCLLPAPIIQLCPLCGTAKKIQLFVLAEFIQRHGCFTCRLEDNPPAVTVAAPIAIKLSPAPGLFGDLA